MKTLNDLNVGQSADVLDILPTSKIRRRLQDIGLVEGTNVQCLFKSPFGDPVAYCIRGAVIAIRADDASSISIN